MAKRNLQCADFYILLLSFHYKVMILRNLIFELLFFSYKEDYKAFQTVFEVYFIFYENCLTKLYQHKSTQQ